MMSIEVAASAKLDQELRAKMAVGSKIESLPNVPTPCQQLPNKLGGFGLPYQDHNYGAPLPPPPTPPLSPTSGFIPTSLNGKSCFLSSPSKNICIKPTPMEISPPHSITSTLPCYNGLDKLHSVSYTHPTSPYANGVEDVSENNSVHADITRCICGFTHDDGYMICCDRCSVWQHIDCMNINRNNIPDTFLCDRCNPRALNREEAIKLQTQKREDFLMASDSSGTDSDVEMNNKVMYSSVQSTPTSLTITSKKQDACQASRAGKKRKRSRENNKRSGKKTPYPARKRSRSKSFCNDTEECGISFSWTRKLREWNETYTEISESVYSQELLQAVLSSSLKMPTKEQSSLSKLREQLAKVQQLRKRVLALEDVSMSHPVAEVCGSYMLSNQFEAVNSALYKRPYPFVFFYNGFDGLEICVDARSSGNISRYIRRSCCPNCEISHVMENGKIHLFIYAKSKILNGSEITIPFDIKYQNCDYSMECGCSQFTDCPVYKFTNMRIELESNKMEEQRKRRLSPLRLSLNRIPNGFSSSYQEAAGLEPDGDDHGDHLRKKSREERKMEAYIRAFEKMEKQEKRKEQMQHAHSASDITKEHGRQTSIEYPSTSVVTSTSDILQAVVMSQPYLSGDDHLVSTQVSTSARRIGNGRRRSTRGRRNSRRGRGASFEGVMSPGACMETDSNHSCDSIPPHCTIFADRYPTLDGESSSLGAPRNPHQEASPLSPVSTNDVTPVVLSPTIGKLTPLSPTPPCTSANLKNLSPIVEHSTNPPLNDHASITSINHAHPATPASVNVNSNTPEPEIITPTPEEITPAPPSPHFGSHHTSTNTTTVLSSVTSTVTTSSCAKTSTATTPVVSVKQPRMRKAASCDTPCTSSAVGMWRTTASPAPSSFTPNTPSFVPWTFTPGVPLGQVHIGVCTAPGGKYNHSSDQFTKKYWLQRAIDENLMHGPPNVPPQTFVAAEKISLQNETFACPKKRYLKTIAEDTVHTTLSSKLDTNVEVKSDLPDPASDGNVAGAANFEPVVPTASADSHTTGLISQVSEEIQPIENNVNIAMKHPATAFPAIEYESLSDDDDDDTVDSAVVSCAQTTQSEPNPSDEQEEKIGQGTISYTNSGYNGTTTQLHLLHTAQLDNTTQQDIRSQVILDPQTEAKLAPIKKKVSLQEYLKRSKDVKKTIPPAPTELHPPVKTSSSSPALLPSPSIDPELKFKERSNVVNKLPSNPTHLLSSISEKQVPAFNITTKTVTKTQTSRLNNTSVKELTKVLNDASQGNLANALSSGLIKTLPPKVMDVVAKAVKTLTTPNDTTKIKHPDPITLQPNNVKEIKEETHKPEKDKLGVSSCSPVISPCSSSSEHRSSIGRCHSSPAIRSTSVKKSSLAQKSPAHRNSFPAPGKSSRMSPVAAKSFASPKLSRSYSSAPLTSPSTPTMHEHRHPTRPEPATTNRDNSSDSFKSRSRHNSGTSSGSNSTMSSKSPRHHTQEVSAPKHSGTSYKHEPPRQRDPNNNNPPQKVPSLTPAVPGQPIPSLARGPGRMPQAVYNRRPSPVSSRDPGSPRWDNYSIRESPRPPKDIRYPAMDYYAPHPPVSPCEPEYRYRSSMENTRHYDSRYRPLRRDDPRGDSRSDRPSYSSYYPSHYPHEPPNRSDGGYYASRGERSLSPGPPRHGPPDYYSNPPPDRPGYYSIETHRR